MMTMQNFLGVTGAVSYFDDEFEHARGSFYSESEKIVGHWGGQLAEHFGLSGAVRREDFERFCEGQEPTTGAQFVRHVKPYKRVNRVGKIVQTSGHSPGCDVTFSAPKSVSLAALVGGDDRVRGAHAEAVSLALRELEKYARARLGGSRPAETTGKLLIASFQHDAARPADPDGYAAPDLHTHNFIFNLTQTAGGRMRPLQPHEIYKCQLYATALYRSKLSETLQKLGYELRVDEKTGAPEIEGISRAYIEASSPRQREIKEMQRTLGAKSSRKIAARKRRPKEYDRDEMKARHQEMEQRFGGQARAVVREARAQAQEMSTLLWDERGSIRAAAEAVTIAVEKASERKAADDMGDMRQFMTDALQQHLGRTTVEAVTAGVRDREARGQLAGLLLDDEAKRRLTAEKTLKMERDNIEKVRAGQGAQPPISDGKAEGMKISRGVTLGESQRVAVEQIVTSRDQIIGLHVSYKAGKATTLAAVREAAERAGYDVKVFVRTTKAAQLLGESGMQTQTLQSFIRRKADPEAPRRFYVLDESNLASTRRLHSLLSRVRPEDRVLLVGEGRRQEDIKASSPFTQLQRHGLATAQLRESVRQTIPPLREVVKNHSAEKITEAVDGLRSQGRITEIADGRERLRAIAKDYCDRPESTLVISLANKECVELNGLIHQERQAKGQISRRDHRTKVLEKRNELTSAGRTLAASYQRDEVIRYDDGSKKHGISAGECARILATDAKENTLTVRLEKSGCEVTYNPQRLHGVSVYREAERQFSEGDRIQFHAPYCPQRVTNGELGTLEKIGKGKLTIKLDSGRRASFEIDKNRFIDHGYAVTSHPTQGPAVNRLLVNADTSEPEKLLNRGAAYIAGFRAGLDVRVYTDSEARLSAALARQADRSAAIETGRKSRGAKALNSPRLIPIVSKPKPTQTEHQAETERPPAQRVSKLQQEQAGPSEPARQADPISTAYYKTLRNLIVQQGKQERLPIPAVPPARPYTIITPVDERRSATELSAQLVQLANANHVARTGQEIAAPVRWYMQETLTKAAGRPPTPGQLESLSTTARTLRLSEPPKVENALHAALWSALNAPDRAEGLEHFVKAAETDYSRTLPQTVAPVQQPEYDISIEF